jgi:hypothetical protein
MGCCQAQNTKKQESGSGFTRRTEVAKAKNADQLKIRKTIFIKRNMSELK